MRKERLRPLIPVVAVFTAALGFARPASADCTGCTTTSAGTDVVHTFTTSGGTFTAPPGVTTVRYLVVGGGAGGGGLSNVANLGGGGGGGAGQYQAGTGFTVIAGTAYTITVGSGGAAGVGGVSPGGGPVLAQRSIFSTITSTGGGGGASNGNNNGVAGASGGGARVTGTGANGTAGNDGGNGNAAGGAGGGGGSGGDAADATGTAGTAGGIGTVNDITGSNFTYAAGGAGGAYGPSRLAGAAGAANTGNGGGGARGDDTAATVNGGAGGSGIVIIRYTPPNGRFAVATGNWNSTATWSSGSCSGAAGAAVPVAGNDVTICATRTVTLNANSANLGTLTIENTGVLNIGNDGTARTLTVAGAVSNAGTLRFNTAAAHSATFSSTFGNSGTLTTAAVTGAKSLTVTGLITNTGTFRFAGTAPMTVNANGGITNGATLDVSTASNTTHVLNVGGGNFTNNGTVNFTADADSLVNTTLSGGAAQALTGTAGNTTFHNLTVNNANGLTLTGTHNATVNNTLTLTAGIITTGTNLVHVVSGNSIAGAGATAFVNGNLRKRFATGTAVARTFEMGSTTGGVRYAPVTVQLGNVTAAGDFTASTTAGDHPDIATSTIVSSFSINRYWTLAINTVAFTADSGNRAVFTFNDPADYDPGADFNAFYAARHVAPNWTEITPSARAATNVTISGATLTTATFGGEYQVGERNEPLPSALADYQMEEEAWNGTADEVIDSSGNDRHGTTNGGPNTANTTPAIPGAPGTCRYGQFDGANEYIDVPNLSSILSGTASLAFWIRTTQNGSDTGWQAPGISGIELSGGSDDIFWGWLDASGDIGISVGNDYSTKSNTEVNDGNWHHVVLTRNHVAGTYKIYIDGVLDASGAIATGVIGTAFSSIGRIEDSGGSPEYFDGDLDEVRVYGTVLGNSQVLALMQSTHYCFSPMTYYSMDESDWSAPASILDSSVNANHASAQNGVAADGYPVADPPAEAIIGSPGTCGAGDIPLNTNTTEVAVTTPVEPDADLGNDGTIMFWYSHTGAWNDGNDRMLFDATQNFGNGNADKHFYLVKRGSGTNGGLRFAVEDSADLNSTADTGAFTFAADTWHHVAVTWSIGVDRIRVYVDGVEEDESNTDLNGTLGDTTTLYFGDNRGHGAIAGTAGNYTQNSANGHLDEVRIFDEELPAASIAGQMLRTHPCAIAGPDHFFIEHDGTGINCQVEPVRIVAHTDAHAEITTYTGSVTLSTNTAHGDWVSTGGSTNVPASGGADSGAATLLFDANDFGDVTIGLKNTHVETVNIGAVDGAVSENTGSAQASEDLDLEFLETGFSFLGNGTPGGIGVQLAAKDSDIAPGNQILEIQAIRTSDDTGACEAALVGPNDIELRLAYVTPGTGTQSIGINGTPVGTGYTPVSLDFGDATDSTAAFVLNYPDAGRIRIDARYDIPLEGGAPSGNLMIGSSNPFVVKPAGLCVQTTDASADCASGDSSCSVFTSAGSTFNLSVDAVQWETAGETNAAFCTGNAVTPNFRLDNIALSSVLVAPAGGVNAALGVTSIDMVASDNGSHQIANQQSVSEVGVFRITATTPAYLGESIASSTSASIGRFAPAALEVTANVPDFAHSCAGSADPFTYMAQPFYFDTPPILTITGLNAGGDVTQNYGGEGAGGADFWMMDSVLANRTFDDPARPAFNYAIGVDASLGGAGDYDGAATLSLLGGNTGASFFYARSGAPVAPFNAEIDALFPAGDLTDADGICYDPEADATCNAYTIPDITGTGAGAAQQRYGRLVLGTAFGSERLSLGLPMRTEYFDGSSFRQNADDACTGISPVELILGSAVEGAQTDGNVVVSSGGACPGGGCSSATVTSDPMTGGNAGLKLGAPGTGFTGYVDITIDLNSLGLLWLRYDWDGGGVPDDSPRGRGSFGVYRGSDEQIYFREMW